MTIFSRRKVFSNGMRLTNPSNFKKVSFELIFENRRKIDNDWITNNEIRTEVQNSWKKLKRLVTSDQSVSPVV